MGPPNHAPHQRPQQNLPRPHVPDERTRDGHQGNSFVSKRPAHWRAVRRLGPEVFPSDHRVLHMRSNTADVNKFLVSSLALEAIEIV